MLPAERQLHHCYFYGPYAKRHGQNTIEKTADFEKPITKNTKGTYKVPSGKIVATCFATDFFLPKADAWRKDAWAMIKERQDLDSLFFTKRIDRFEASLPTDWGDGYDNINIGCTVENQALAELRLPFFSLSRMAKPGRLTPISRAALLRSWISASPMAKNSFDRRRKHGIAQFNGLA